MTSLSSDATPRTPLQIVSPDDVVGTDPGGHAVAPESRPLEIVNRPHDPLKSALVLGAFAVPVVAAAVVGARVGPARPGTRRWYEHLSKPPFQPPAAVFAPVWTALYASIAVSGWQIWKAPDQPARRPALALWGAQLAANAAWTPTFFGARRPKLALAVLGTQLAATVAYATVAAKVDQKAAALVGPYTAWSAFAGVLNAEIVRRNPNE